MFRINGGTRACVYVTIIEDRVRVEPNKVFLLRLTSTDVPVFANQAVVVIQNQGLSILPYCYCSFVLERKFHGLLQILQIAESPVYHTSPMVTQEYANYKVAMQSYIFRVTMSIGLLGRLLLSMQILLFQWEGGITHDSYTSTVAVLRETIVETVTTIGRRSFGFGGKGSLY